MNVKVYMVGLMIFMGISMSGISPMHKENELSSDGIYKIVERASFNKNNSNDCIVLSPLDRDSRFIHASYGRQVMGTLEKFFKGKKEVLAIELRPDVFENYGNIVKREANKPGGDYYIHIYGEQKIPLQAIIRLFTLEEQPDGSWKIFDEKELF